MRGSAIASAARRRSTSSRSSVWSMSATSPVVELEGQAASSAAYERRWAVFLAFALCLAVGGALVARDGPAETAPRVPPLTLPAGTTHVALFTFPHRLANQAPSP